LADPTRLRLLTLLEREELTVAELARVTCLAQPRVSTHLARLREAGLVIDRRDGVSVYYRMHGAEDQPQLLKLWQLLRNDLDDALVDADRQRLEAVLVQRVAGQSWPDAVAGDMERHYSPGRTWEATARALVHLINPGHVLDIASGDGVMAELLAQRAAHIDCLDRSTRVVAAGKRRVAHLANVAFHRGDMHHLPFADAGFDTVLLLHALTYSEQPGQVFKEARRVLNPGGVLLGATLAHHQHREEVKAFGHVNPGFTIEELHALIESADMAVRFCAITSIERKTPNHQVITFLVCAP